MEIEGLQFDEQGQLRLAVPDLAGEVSNLGEILNEQMDDFITIAGHLGTIAAALNRIAVSLEEMNVGGIG